MADTESKSAGPRSRTAAEWFGLLHGEPSDAERAAFDVWHADPLNARAYARLEETWAQARFLKNMPVGRSRDLARARPRRWVGPGIAAGIAALVAIGVFGWQFGGIQHRMAGEARIGKAIVLAADGLGLRYERLPDGSRVTLDHDTRLALRFSAGQRRVELLAGRARFDVVHDAARPFVVDAGPGRIVDRGTVFDVALRARAVRVSLIRGEVEVSQRGIAPHLGARSRVLAPGQEIVFDATSLPPPITAPASRPDWTSDMITFEAMPLDGAIAAFNSGGGQRIELDAPGVRQVRLNGAFRRDDPDGFASSVAATFGLRVQSDNAGKLHLTMPAQREASKKVTG